MSLGSIPRLGRSRVARVTGGFYLAFILASVLGDRLAHIGISSSEQLYQAIAMDAWSFRVGFVIVLISAFLFLVAAWGLYVILRSVDEHLALLFLLLNAVGVAVQGASMLSLVHAMSLGVGAGPMQAFSAAEVEGLAYASIDVYRTGFATAQLFFGAWLFPLGYLVYRSGALPRFLGVLLLLDGVGVLIWFFQALLLPEQPAISYPGLAVSFVAEVGLGLWLLIMGVKGVDQGSVSSGRELRRDRST